MRQGKVVDFTKNLSLRCVARLRCGAYPKNGLPSHVSDRAGRGFLSLCFGIIFCMIRKDPVISGTRNKDRKSHSAGGNQ